MIGRSSHLPRVRLERADRLPRIGRWPLLALLVWGVLVGTSLVVARAGMPVQTCVFEGATGVPCPTCGGTRAAGHLLDGAWGTALVTNPLLVAVLGALLASLLLRVVAGRRLSLTWPGLPAAWTWSAAAALVLANWAYVIATL
ncbi:MAG: DUF2752 domain-containing protein [Planctomycetota bacterium]